MDYLALYAAVLSTIISIPVFADLRRNYIKPLRFICLSYSAYDFKKGKDMKILNLFDITIVNRSKEEVFLSKIEIKLKQGKNYGILTHTSRMINVDFSNKLSPRQSIREYGRLSNSLKNLNEQPIVDIKQFDYFQIIVESSVGKTFKSKWFKHKMTFNDKTAIWKKLESFDEYNSLLSGAIK
ncbi:MAG: hypothetical protein ACOYMA_15805 [Bacteroidia bacterium]